MDKGVHYEECPNCCLCKRCAKDSGPQRREEEWDDPNFCCAKRFECPVFSCPDYEEEESEDA